MKFKAVPDQQDPFGGAFNPAWDDSNFVFLPPGERRPLPGKTPIPPTPALTNEAIIAKAAQTGPTTTVVVTEGGITFDLIFDAAAMAAPASFRAGIEEAAAILAATISNKITVDINIDYSGTGGGASAGPDNGQFVPYSTVRADLIADAAPGDTTFNSLPTGSTIGGQSEVAVWNTQLKIFGLLAPNAPTDDGSATFATDIDPSLLVGVALHELTHAMGRVPYGPQPDIFDFYRFTGVGTRLFSDSIPAKAAFFSLDGGHTKLADYGLNSDPSDFLNSGVQGPNDPFNEFYSGNTLQQLTAVDLKQLDALGFNIEPVFSGNRSDYQITYNSAMQTLTVTDERPGSPDGIRTLTDVQQLQFANGSSTYAFNAAGALVSETFDNVNGSHWVNAFDTVGNQTWVWEISTYDASGNLTTQTGLNDDGTHFLTLYDVDHQYSWTTATIDFDANWHWTSVAGTDANGSVSLTSLDVAAAYDVTQWSTIAFDTIVNQAPVSGVITASVNSEDAGHSGIGPRQDGFVFNFASANSTVADHQISHSELFAAGVPLSVAAHAAGEYIFEHTFASWSDSHSAEVIAKLPGFDVHHASGFLLA